MNPTKLTQLKQILHNFQDRYLRINPPQQERLQLNLPYQWNINKQKFNLISKPPNLMKEERDITEEETVSYFNIAMLMFPEISSEQAFDVQIMDTLFYMNDHTITYLYRDQKKGLVKVRSKGMNMCELFLKKGKRKDNMSPRGKQANKNRSMFSLFNQEKSQKSIGSSLGYIALLKYKDGSFLRLKQGDLRSIFTNPLYANQRFKHNNCTQYIQALPPEGAEQFRIHYNWNKFKDQPLMKVALSFSLGNSPYGQRSAVRKVILEHSELVYLHYSIFQICKYICVHYNKRIEAGLFHFVKIDQGWSLAEVEGGRLSVLETNQFMRAQLWDSSKKVHFGQFMSPKDQVIFQKKQQNHSQLYREIEDHFERTNCKIKTEMSQFVQSKLDNIRKTKDKNISKVIFQILHPNTNNNLYDLLQSPQHLAKLLEQDQNSTVRKNRPKPQINSTMKQSIRKPKVPLLQQILKRQNDKERFVYRGIQSS